MIRSWKAGDEVLAVAAEPYLSVASLSHRFLAGTGGRLPAGYVRHIAAGPRDTWDACVAVGDGHLIGWAEFGRVPGVIDSADLAVLVADPWHRRGIATALIREMLPCAASAGIRDLSADVMPSNHAAQALLRSIFGPKLSSEYEDGVVRYYLPLVAALAVTPSS